jgi:hypothetical protein
MKRTIALMLLGFCGTALQAAPLAFTDALYLTNALATAGATTDTNSDSNPASAFPLLTAAAADSDTASASAAGSADLGFLGSTAAASSTADPASALGSAEFIGNFIAPAGTIRLSLNFDTLNNGSDGTSAESSILLTLIADGETLLSELFTSAQSIDRLFVLPVGALASLDLLLIGSADASAGDALAVATLTFQASQVPVAPTCALLLMGLFVLGYRLQRKPAHYG